MIDPDYHEEDYEELSGDDFYRETLRDIIEEHLERAGVELNPLDPHIPDHVMQGLREEDVFITQNQIRELYGLPPLYDGGLLPTQRHQDTPRSLPRYTPRRPYARLDFSATLIKPTTVSMFYRSLHLRF